MRIQWRREVTRLPCWKEKMIMNYIRILKLLVNICPKPWLMWCSIQSHAKLLFYLIDIVIPSYGPWLKCKSESSCRNSSCVLFFGKYSSVPLKCSRNNKKNPPISTEVIIMYLQVEGAHNNSRVTRIVPLFWGLKTVTILNKNFLI